MASVGDTNIHIQVNGTTFSGMYERVGSMVELVSADFGHQSAEIGGRDPHGVAEQLLRHMVERAVHDGAVFVRDDDK